jgi:lysophospholipase L1-like esterase
MKIQNQYISLLMLICFLIPFHIFAQQAATRKLADPRQWSSAMAAFGRQDSLALPAAGSILFSGSSSIRLWSTLATDFPNKPVLNRGFGGSQFTDVNYYFEQVVLKYRPRQVVLYVGDNDLGAGATSEEVFESFRTFAERMRRELPGSRLLYISIKPSPSRWSMEPHIVETNRRIRRYCRWHNRRRFLDVHQPMLQPSGRPRPELYRSDSLHMTPAGYELWKRLVGPRLVK